MLYHGNIVYRKTGEKMKKIICFGDSNTFGFNPKNGGRYNSETRWTGVLAKLIGEEFDIIEEGCNNRTAFFVNPDGLLQSGQKYLPICLEKHKKIDIFILALGTNDLQKSFEIDENIVQDGLKNIINFVRKFNPNVRIITIPPVILNETILNGYFQCQFDENSIKNSRLVQRKYETIAKQEGCDFWDLNNYICPSTTDGLHFDVEAHKIMAHKLAEQILNVKTEKHSQEGISISKC